MSASPALDQTAWRLELWRFLDTEPTEIPYTTRHSRLKEWRLRFKAWRFRRDRRHSHEGRNGDRIRGMDAPMALLFSFWHITGYSPNTRSEAVARGAFRFVDFRMGGVRVSAHRLSEWASIYARLAPSKESK